MVHLACSSSGIATKSVPLKGHHDDDHRRRGSTKPPCACGWSSCRQASSPSLVAPRRGMYRYRWPSTPGTRGAQGAGSPARQPQASRGAQRHRSARPAMASQNSLLGSCCCSKSRRYRPLSAPHCTATKQNNGLGAAPRGRSNTSCGRPLSKQRFSSVVQSAIHRFALF